MYREMTNSSSTWSKKGLSERVTKANNKGCYIYIYCLVFFRLFQSYVVAIIIPDQETLEPWARSKKIPGNFAELCENEVVNKDTLVILRSYVNVTCSRDSFSISLLKLHCSCIASCCRQQRTPTQCCRQLRNVAREASCRQLNARFSVVYN